MFAVLVSFFFFSFFDSMSYWSVFFCDCNHDFNSNFNLFFFLHFRIQQWNLPTHVLFIRKPLFDIIVKPEKILWNGYFCFAAGLFRRWTRKKPNERTKFEGKKQHSMCSYLYKKLQICGRLYGWAGDAWNTKYNQSYGCRFFFSRSSAFNIRCYGVLIHMATLVFLGFLRTNVLHCRNYLRFGVRTVSSQSFNMLSSSTTRLNRFQ